MTRVDFYISEEEELAERLACRIAEKAYRSGATVYIHTESAEHCAAVDKFLWTFREASFVPHQRVEDYDPEVPVHIGYGENAPEAGVLINLTETVPLFFSNFARMAEIICSSNKEAGRMRYRFYKERGYPLHSHVLDAQK